MGQTTKIEWCDHTLSSHTPQSKSVVMHSPVARLAERAAIIDVKAKLWKFGPSKNVVCVQISASIIPTMNAGKAVAGHYIKAPALKQRPAAISLPLCRPPVFIRRAVLSTQSARAHYGADFFPCFGRVPGPNAVAWARLRCRAHFGATFIRHSLALHRGNESFSSLQPRLANYLAAGKGIFSHGG